MLLNIKQLSRENIDYIKLNFDFDVKKENFVSEILDDFNVKVNGNCQRSNSILTINYVSEFKVNCNCDRCLAYINRKFSSTNKHIIDENRLLQDNSYEEYNVFLNNNFFDLTLLVTSDIILEFPHKLLCSENCLGFCGKCGVNKNYDNCFCNENTIDPRMEVLKQLLK